jgi:hypothetical protein
MRVKRYCSILLEPHCANAVIVCMHKQATFKGNKSNLPSRFCEQCGLMMVWRKAWAKNWEAVKYCSDKCRAKSKAKSSKMLA